MPIFRKKAVEIEAQQFTGKNFNQIFRFIQKATPVYREGNDIIIETLEGTHRARPLDWIIKGVKGEFYPCKPEIFSITYEQIEDS